MNNDKEIVRDFIAAILLQSVKDWINPPTHQTQDEISVSKDEIREFLTNEMYGGEKWSETLCRAIDLTPEVILRKLESDDIYADLLTKEDEVEQYE